MLSDKFIPAEGFNSTFTEIRNCDIISRPSKTGVQQSLFWFTSRPGLYTEVFGGVNAWQTDANIAGAHYNNNKIYPYSLNGTVYEFNGDVMTSIDTGGYYDSARYNNSLQMSFLGGGRYPNKYTVFTVSTYDSVTATITTSETLTAQQQLDLPGKYVYVKTGPAQWGVRAIDSVPTTTTIKLASGFGVSPVATNIFHVYTKRISQSWFPQIRQGNSTTHYFSVNATITVAPTAGATYTNNSITYTVVSTDLSSGKGTIKCTGTGSPTLTGTLTKATGTGDATITFYDSDIASERFLAIDNEGNKMYWYYPNAIKLVKWDNRIFQLNKDNINILPTDSNDLEIVLSTKIIPTSTTIMNISSYSGYLLIFYKDSIGLLRKTITNTATQDFVYTYQDLCSVGLYSQYSFINWGSNLYFFGNDNVLYALSLTSNGAEVVGTPEPQAQLMVEYFKNISGGDISFKYNRGILRMIHKGDTDVTVYKFYESYKGWITDDYAYTSNSFAFMYSIDNFDYMCKSDKVYRLQGFTDDGALFRQSIKLEGPLQEFLDTFNYQKTKIRFGFDGINRIAGKVNIETGGTKSYTKDVDITKTERIDEINSYVEGNGMIGGNLVGDVLLGGTPGFGELKDYYSSYQDITVNLGKKGQRYKVEIYNDTGYQMMFGGLKNNYVMMNTNAVPNKTVL